MELLRIREHGVATRRRRRVRKVFIICSFIVVALQWTFITATSVVSATGISPETIIETSATSGKALESLWEAFKNALESAAAAKSQFQNGASTIGRESATTSTTRTNKPTSLSQHADSSGTSSSTTTSQRYLLMKRSLQQHYTKHLVESSSPYLDDYNIHVSSTTPTLEEGLKSLGSSSKLDRPIRWERTMSIRRSNNSNNDHGSEGEQLQPQDQQIVCYCYSESVGAYWSFQWCPQRGVYQGILAKHMTLNIKHSLGSYHQQHQQQKVGGHQQPGFVETTSTTTSTSTATDATTTIDAAVATELDNDNDSPSTIFIQDLRHRFGGPVGTTVELYDNGAVCDESFTGNSILSKSVSSSEEDKTPRRITGVVLHHPKDPYALEHCPTSFSTPIIESVDEYQVCQYVIHVCMPPTDDETDDSRSSNGSDSSHHTSQQQQEQPRTISESKANQINETMHSIHEVLDTYLHRDVLNRQVLDRTTSLRVAMPPLPPSRVEANKQLIRDMFTHAYDGYMYKAYPASELKPITCKPAAFHLVQIPALTLIDSLDMLIVMGNHTEFARSVERLRVLHNRMAMNNKILDRNGGVGGLFALNQNVSVFETNIRVLGGLLSGHQLAEAYLKSTVPMTDIFSHDGNVLIGPIGAKTTDDSLVEMTCTETLQVKQTTLESNLDIPGECSSIHSMDCDDSRVQNCQNKTLRFWAYDGFLLELAQDIGSRLLPAFSTKTGIPYGTVNLLSGIPKGETTIASLAGGGTLSLEMELLSRLSGDPSYGQAAKLSARAMWMRRSSKNLLGKHLCTHRGEWTESLSGIGSNSDSFYEYLVKHHVLFPEDEDFWLQMVAAYGGIHNESRVGEWYSDVDMTYGSYSGVHRRVFEALMAFYPGMQVLLGELTPAARSLNSFFMVREYLGFLPERFNFGLWKVDGSGGKHHLRPELLESAYFMHRATKGMRVSSRTSGIYANMTAGDAFGISGWQWANDFALHTLEEHTRTVCGYASIKELSPVSTGLVSSQSTKKQRGKVRLMNEMPSFFLSETLKYLYLTFDDNNSIHTDSDREWVFTTEAHPIHYVPSAEERAKKEERVKLEKERVKELLKSRIKGDRRKSSSSWQALSKEKWTEGTQLRSYMKKMEPVLVQVVEDHLTKFKKHVFNREKQTSTLTNSTVNNGEIDFFTDINLVEPFLSADQTTVFDFFDEGKDGGNAAHLTFRKRGYGRSLQKACPNYYASDLFWVHALNGGANDYADVYLSTAFDEIGESSSRFYVLGALDALAVQGSGLHVADFFEAHGRCPVRRKSVSHTPVVEDGKALEETNSDMLAKAGRNRFDLGGELGSFEVSAFPGGTGFFIQHIDSAETMVATLIDESTEEDTSDFFVMVYSHAGSSQQNLRNKRTGKRSSSWRLSDSRWTSLFKRGEQDPELPDPAVPQRSVIMADLQGNAFVCFVEIVHSVSSANGGDESAEADSDEDETAGIEEEVPEVVVGKFPCAPALFGPTHVSELVVTGGAVVEAVVRPPEVGDEYGCAKADGASAESELIPTVIDQTDASVTDSNPTFVDKEQSEQELHEAMPAGIPNDHTCRDSEVRLVRRGVCTFQEKSANQWNLHGSEAVIMINNEDDELFVMSGGGRHFESEEYEEKYPATVLVTGSDGEAILSLVEAAAEDETLIVTARVSVLPQDAVFQESGESFTVSGNDYWPAVRASPEGLQIFAEGGWGVYAVQREGASKDSSLEWQLYLMRHDS